VKKDIHPQYQLVVFQDTASGASFLIGSTATSSETIKWEDGNTYPLVKVEVSSASHPFYTGKQKQIEKGGRVERFQAKLARAKAGKKA
jgi:large subunit ribosomal protein L31